jgi:dihydropteroate synthase
MNRAHVMGIVNITPDSFSDGGEHASPRAATGYARKLAKEGAAILDIGGESTRPGARTITPAEEIGRIKTTLAALADEKLPVSVDTRNSATMRMAIDAGAAMINDVSALLHDAQSLATVAESGLPVVLMHAQGDPRTMQDAPRYRDVLADVYRFLAERVTACERAGIDRSRIIIDPGIGFGKTLAHNLTLLKNLALFHGLGCPLMLGASRKSFIAAIDKRAADHSDRLPGSLAAALHGARLGVQFLRVHDVAATVQILSVSQAIHDL